MSLTIRNGNGVAAGHGHPGPPIHGREHRVTGFASLARTLAAAAAVLALAACSSSSGGGKPQIKYGTPAVSIARALKICTNPEADQPGGARCVFPDGQIIAIDSIEGPADQQQEVPSASANDFCELVGHGFGVTGTSYTQLKAYVDINGLVARYGGQLAGGGC